MDTPIYRWRGLGFLNDPNDLAQFLIALLPLLWLRWKKGNPVSNFLLTILPAGVLIFGIYSTHSRGGAMALGLVVLFAFKDKLGLIGSTILTGLAAAGALAIGITGGNRGITEDDGGRVNLWFEAVQAFKSHPVFGLGPDQFKDFSSTHQTAHNSYILCMAELGLFGYFFWLGTVVAGWEGLTLRLKNFARTQKKAAALAPTKPLFDLTRVKAAFSNETASGMVLAGAAAGQHQPFTPQEVSVAAAPVFADPMRAQEDEATLAYAARIFQISLVGLMGAAFFLTRTYALPLYIFLGMASAMNGLGSQEGMKIPVWKLIRKIWIVIVVSILVLYVVIRVRGRMQS